MPRLVRFDFVVDGAPAEVARRLKAQTRFRLLPYQSSFLGRGGLGGRVRDDGFRVALDDRQLVQTAQAVAIGTFTPEGPGRTRVRGEVGLPTGATWGLRLAVLGVVTAVGVVGATLFSAADLAPVTAAAGLAAYAAFAAGIGVVGIGRQVANADAQVEPALDRLQTTLIADAPPAAQAQRARRPAVEREG